MKLRRLMQICPSAKPTKSGVVRHSKIRRRLVAMGQKRLNSAGGVHRGQLVPGRKGNDQFAMNTGA